MNQIGRNPKFKINRKLTDQEYKDQLKPYPLNPSDSINPCDEFVTAIKMNSSYLELVDRCFSWRGFLIFAGLPLVGLGIFVIILSTIVFPGNNINLIFIFMDVAIVATLWGAAYCLIKDEWSDLTHNPIRFDRRNRMVYAFLYNKEVVAAPWEDIFFCICDGSDFGGMERDIRGHILADDGVTVKATFALGHRESYLSKSDDYDNLELGQYWSFINRYMERGPEELVSMVKIYHPIADQKESPMWGFNTLFSNYGPCGFLIFPLLIFDWGCRFLAIATGKRPVWPDWVEEKCKIEPDDPYARDARFNPPIKFFTNFKEMNLHYRKQRFQSAPSDQNPLDEVPYQGGGLSVGVVMGIIFGTILPVALLWWIF